VPEGDTIWLAAHRLHEMLAGRVITHSDFRVPRYATANLTGRTVAEVASRGKHLLLRTDDGLTLHTHLRMDGAWQRYRTGARWSGGPAWQVRVVIANDEWQAVGYRLPIVELLRTADEPRVVGHLGPDLLGADWDAEEAVRRLRARPDRAIGPALLDQRNLAGIGNLYANEIAFLCGVTPWQPAQDVDLESAVSHAHRLLDANKTFDAQPTTGSRRRGEEHWVYRRTGRPCRRCGTRIREAMHAEASSADQARVSYWCPGCQTGPSPGPGGK